MEKGKRTVHAISIYFKIESLLRNTLHSISIEAIDAQYNCPMPTCTSFSPVLVVQTVDSRTCEL